MTICVTHQLLVIALVLLSTVLGQPAAAKAGADGGDGVDFWQIDAPKAALKLYKSPKVNKLKETAGSKTGGRKFQGVDDKGPIRARVDRAHPENPNYTGPRDPLHTKDHVHIERRANGDSGPWQTVDKTEMPYPFDW